jgi:phytoene desaturase
VNYPENDQPIPNLNKIVPKTVIVIGAGFGGISVALRMRAKGYNVKLIDRLESIGGRAQVFERNGFKHDAGPTVITAPFLFEELFELFSEELSNYLEIVGLDTWYNFYFHDGKSFSYYRDLNKTKNAIAEFNPKDVDGYSSLLSASKKIFDVGFSELADQPFVKFAKMLEQVPKLLGLKSYLTVNQFVERHIKNKYLRQAFSIHPLLVGGNPFSTTSIYALIHYLERQWGVHFCMGGTGKLVKELSALMVRNGVSIELGREIKKIVIKNKRATGIVDAKGVESNADIIVFGGDAPYAYENMLPKNLRRQLIRRPDRYTKYSMGMFVLYFGARQTWPNVAHHTIWLGPRFKELLKDIFDYQTLSDDFSIYLHRPTATDKSFAPSNCDSFYALCPVPNLQANINWDVQGPLLRDKIVTALDATILPGLTKSITDDFWMTPVDFKNNYLSQFGAGFSISPIFSQSAYFRYHNRDPDIRNLYFTGAGTHPGAGLPGVISSAKIVEKLIAEDIL